jgi:uncharacterized NAD(P)/FAD-binding protein YdhS
MKSAGHGAASTATASTTTRVVAVVGAGFSGICVAIQLLRRAGLAPLRVALVEPRADLGAGLAYATRDYPYPLNVAAGQMSVDAARANDFLQFARAQGIQAGPADYLPRPLYGEYLRARFAEANLAAGDARALHYRARVLQLRRSADARWELWLDDGSALRADDVVLALGNGPPAALPALADISTSGHYVDDPWSIGLHGHENIDSVLLVGSGLTMVDAALRLAAIRPRVRHIHVLSRHGLLPESQASAPRPAIGPDAGAIGMARGSLRRMLRAWRRLAGEIGDAGGDWRELFALLRAQVPDLWHSLDAVQRARFLRHARAHWDVHRHRVPTGPLSAVRSLERLGVLEVHAGRLESARLLDDVVAVQWRPRGAHRSRAWLVNRVINCTGPDHLVLHSPDPLVKSLLANGLIRPDAHSLGIEVAAHGQVLSASAAPVDGLYYIGPWLRARDWEATAVPELRAHAARLAQVLSGEALALSA